MKFNAICLSVQKSHGYVSLPHPTEKGTDGLPTAYNEEVPLWSVDFEFQGSLPTRGQLVLLGLREAPPYEVGKSYVMDVAITAS